jgi:hypothetical protein
VFAVHEVPAAAGVDELTDIRISVYSRVRNSDVTYEVFGLS